MLLEQLVNNTPPSCIQSNLVSVIEVASPRTIIKELPSLSTIRRGRTVLHVVVTTLAAYRLAKKESWKQLFTDGTSRRQSAKQNLSIAIQSEEGRFIPVLLDTNILPENEESNTILAAIFRTVEMKGILLTRWIEMHERMFEAASHDIPLADKLSLVKLGNHGIITTESCNDARKLDKNIGRNIVDMACEANITFTDDNDETVTYGPIIYEEYCHHHL